MEYYTSLLDALERVFGIRMSLEGLATREKVFLLHFRSTVRSLLQISNPWENYLDESLLVRKLDENPELATTVRRTTHAICAANATSEAAHREMLDALFRAIFGECDRVVTSDELLAAGFDDSREPNSADYYDSL